MIGKIGRRCAVGGAFASLLLVIALAAALGQAPGQVQSSAREPEESLGVRFARANLRLAEIDLKIVLAGNQKLPNLHTTHTIMRLRNSVAYAKEMLRYEMDRQDDGRSKLYLLEVEGDLALAESDLKTATAANRQATGSVNDLEIERLRSVVDVAQLAVEKARSLSATHSPAELLQWQVDRLRSDLTRIGLLADELASHN